MKKTLIITIALIVLSGALYFFMNRAGLHRGNSSLTAGGTPENFTLGMKGSTAYGLSDIIGKYIIVLAFLDNNIPSGKFLDIYKARFSDYILSRHDIIWFNIKKDALHAVIEEQTKHLNLLYRMPVSGLPDFYNFKNMPAILVIDKNGVIKLAYSGYSPTIINDLRAGLSVAAK
jgi:hypothetical protein